MDEDKRIDRIRRVCLRDQLLSAADSGKAISFEIQRRGAIMPAFAIEFEQNVHAYVNVCPHRGTSLDWLPGEVFDETGLYLICATHGALFEPDTGLCVAGPCQGATLTKIPLTIDAPFVVLTHDILGNFTDT